MAVLWPLGGRYAVQFGDSYIATFMKNVDTRYVMLAKITNKDTQTVVSALIKQAKRLPSGLSYKSLTSDIVATIYRTIDDLR